MKRVYAYRTARRASLRKAGYAAAAAALVLGVFEDAYSDVSQVPLYLGGGNVPGNLVLVPSVEWPTINSVANLGPYAESTRYIGYFNPAKCYEYNHDPNDTLRHFYPVADASTNHRCNGQWSGNFLNWAATQTIDPFRMVLTGGYRVKDTATETWLEKARHDGQGGSGIYPNRRIPESGSDEDMVRGATPFDADYLHMRIQGLGNEMRFRLESNDVDRNATYYDPSSGASSHRGYDVTIRVSVCVPGHLEPNCRRYAQGWKPEGLIQEYSEDLRVSVFGYLNDHDMRRDGGVLRARQKFVGPNMLEPGEAGRLPNPRQEWDPDTGVQMDNPDPADASATSAAFGISINDSGVINYLNKFGQMTSQDHKNHDPVSEMYYAALRYLKNQGNVSAYTSMGGNGTTRYRYADGFPVITNWDDPVQYACQKNVILGIGDIYTHRDKNLPGSTYGADEPTMPNEVRNDGTLNAVTWTNRVGAHEGLGNIGNTNSWTGRNNSAYLAGLAYYANTQDLRPDDIPGIQTASTHWVDVLEDQTLEVPAGNQYFLATKYGGFKVPDDVEFDPTTFTGSLPLDWWHTNGEILTSFGSRASPAGVSFARPDNYYLAGGADEMVESLTRAFARISAELRSSASSVAANSTRVDTDTAVFQASFDSRRWSGELQAFRIDEEGTIANTPAWNAGAKLDALTESQIASRKIFTVTPPVPEGGASISTNGTEFLWASLAASQQDALRAQPDGTQTSIIDGQRRLGYLRGSRADEPPTGLFRQRDSRLGDIVNSDPQFVHKQDYGYTLLSQSGAFNDSVASAYRSFRQSAAYQSRVPMVVVGGNDGMLHGFHAGLDSSGGTELFAFVPNNVFEHLYELTLPEYEHRYYVDGTPRVADAWLGGGLGWRTIVVGTTAAGGQSVFALDITNPESMTSSSVLWEFQHPDLGYTMGQPSIAPLPNGQFGVVVTSGYTGSDDGKLWVLDPANGSIIHTFNVPNSGDLGAPLVVDLNSDRVADRIYVGDTDGNLWRFDLDGSSAGSWGAPAGLQAGGEPVPLFVARDGAGNRQPITAPLTSAFNHQGRHMVFFGTGSFYRIDDNVVRENPPINSFYGIIDRGEPIVDRDELVEQEILTEQTADSGFRVRGVTAREMDSGDDGWFIDLVWKGTYGGPGAKGERIVARALVRGDRIIFTTLIPNEDPCSFGGDSWLMELHSFTGGRLTYAVFDIDVDGDFDEADSISVTMPDGETIEVPVSGLDPGIGIMETPAVIAGRREEGSSGEPSENKIVSGSSGELLRIRERGSMDIGRQSWRQLR